MTDVRADAGGIQDARRESATASVRQLRSRLLDLTARNPLISFPHGRATGTRVHVRAVNGHVDALFAHLGEGKSLNLRPLPPPGDEPEDEKQPQFRAALEAARLTDERYLEELAALSVEELTTAKAAAVEVRLRDRVRASLDMPPRKAASPIALADYAARLGIDPSFDLRPSPAGSIGRARGSVDLQALALPDALERQLAKIRDTARTVAEETGVSTLHLAFGFLEWYESEVSERPITSPLLLLRVDIDRRIARSRYQYSVSAVGDEAEVNLTLSERLGRDFRIKLPPLGEEEAPEGYLARVHDEVCKGRPRWTVRRFVTLAHFPFARLAMFHDLDEDQWPGGLASHPVLASLLGGREAGSATFASEHDVDAPEVSAKVPVMVLEADASQHSAVYDVMCGEDLVIEGPPGTGKSQTITNIVAAALSNGKRVLFVADKQAALQVVKDRLDKVGLGDFCLELHSGKARKTDVLASLKQRLERPPAPARVDRLDDKLRELSSTRAALTRYVSLLNAPFGALGLTVHDVLWADRRRREPVDAGSSWRLDEVSLPSPEALSASELETRRAALDRFETAAAPILAAFENMGAHPWWGVTRAGLPAVDMEQAIRDTADAATSMGDVAKSVEDLHSFGLDRGTTLDGLGPIAQALVALKIEEEIPAGWFSAFATADVRVAAAEWRKACERYREAVGAQSALITLPDGLDPGDAAARLEAAWSATPHESQSSGSLRELGPLAAGLRTEAALLAKMGDTAAATIACLRMDAAANLGEVATAAAAVTLATELSESVVGLMTPEMMRRGSAEIVAAAVIAIRAALTRRSEINAEYSIPPSLEPALLRRHASALAASGMFGFMSSAVKEARLCFGGLLRVPQKIGKEAMASAMVRVAEHLELVATIEADAAFRAAFGGTYRGIATDLDGAVAAVAWAERVRAAFAQESNESAIAASTLLLGDPDRLRRIRALAGRPEHGEMLVRLAQYPPTAVSFDNLAERLIKRAEFIDAFASVCEALGIPGATRAGEVPGIIAAIRTTARTKEEAVMPGVLESALTGTFPGPLDDLEPFDAALRLAIAVDRAPLPQTVRDALWLTSPETIRSVVIPAASGLMVALGVAVKQWAGLKARLGLDENSLLGSRIGAATPSKVRARLSKAAANPRELRSWIPYLREREAAEALGLGSMLNLWDERVLNFPLRQAFDRVFYHALARSAFARHPELDRFTGLGQQEARARFASLDAEAVVLRRQRLVDELGRYQIPIGIGSGKRSEFTDRSLVLLEIGKQKRHIPIRQLLDRAGGCVQAMKPCFMMSPLSVAQYLKPGRLRFDLLVIDEASQMRPEDAVGAVVRCGQIVVVGDPKQLPPTTFFARSNGEDEDDGTDEEVDAESILDLAQTVFRPMRRLRWHYRSRHGSLVAFSNREFYDEDLMVFPSPSEARAEQGVASVKVDGIYKARANFAEVEAVCAAAVEHMRTRPDRSLGIATMNGVQRDLIAQEMDRLAAELPEVEAYRERWSATLERFFVKNLENVQGDERDVIFISTVFGPSAPGAKVLQRFGPINGASGHRRLNVLFTRAKHNVRLFTSMTPDDITAGPDSPRGAQVLKAYLAYAQTGRLDAGKETGREADSDFEVFVRDRLRAAGYEAVPQVGVAGFFIDLAVLDPRSPATFLLGIECDGASYHSSRSARDRDILRQHVLEGLGWTIYRIWSTDWFRDPEGQTNKLLSFIQAAARRHVTA